MRIVSISFDPEDDDVSALSLLRACNADLVEHQERLDCGFLFAALGVSRLWIVPLLSPRPDMPKANRYGAVVQ